MRILRLVYCIVTLMSGDMLSDLTFVSQHVQPSVFAQG